MRSVLRRIFSVSVCRPAFYIPCEAGKAKSDKIDA